MYYFVFQTGWVWRTWQLYRESSMLLTLSGTT